MIQRTRSDGSSVARIESSFETGPNPSPLVLDELRTRERAILSRAIENCTAYEATFEGESACGRGESNSICAKGSLQPK